MIFPVDGDGVLLQAVLDSGFSVQLPEQRLTLNRPVYASSGCDLRGTSAKSELYSPQRDAIVVMPAGQRNYDPAQHIVANAVDSSRWAFRSRSLAGLRFQNTVGDAGWPGADNWRAVRQFAVEMTITRHGNNAAIAGLAWRKEGATFRASPWLLYSHSERPEQVDFRLGLADDTQCEFRCRIGAPLETPFKLVFKINLDAGTFVCEKNDAVITDVLSIGAALTPGAVLMENRGSPLWLGGCTEQAGGHCPPELDQADVTFHTFRIWKTATPPATGYPWFSTSADTAFVLPLNDEAKPKVGDPAVTFYGQQNGFGYCVSLSNSPGWAVGVRVEGVTFVGEDNCGTGLSIISAIDVSVNRCRFIKDRVGLQIMGGPLSCYPVRVRDLYGDHNTDCLARMHRSIVREFENVTAKYPGRSVARFDQCGQVEVRDVFHAGENAGSSNTVTDCLRLDGCGLMTVDSWLSNYEDGAAGGPRYSYLRVTGSHPEPSMTQLLRIRDFAKQALRPSAKYIDDAGLSAACVRQISDSFGQ